MGEKITKQDLLANGVDPDVLEKAWAAGKTTQVETSLIRFPEPETNRLVELMLKATFDPVIQQHGTTWIGIGGWVPAPLNELERSVKAKIRLKARDRVVILEAYRRSGLPPASRKRALSMRIVLPKNQRRWDPDALWKSCLDACVHAGFLVNDSPVWLELGRLDYASQKGPLHTTLIFEDL